MLMIRNLYQILATLHHLRICTDSLKISTDSHSYVLSYYSLGRFSAAALIT